MSQKIREHGASTASPTVRRKTVLLDLARHCVTHLAGDPDYFGRELAEGGVVEAAVILSTIHPEDLPKLLDIFETLPDLGDGEEFHYELRMVKPDGKIAHCRYVSVPHTRNRQGRVSVVHSEVEIIDEEP